METYTLRWSADRSLYFVEPARGRNARGFWLGCEKEDYPIPPEIIKNPYSGAFAFDGYWRRWFSMRGFIVRQALPQIDVPGEAELVRDYFAAKNLVTHDTISTAAADAWFDSFGEKAARHFAREAAKPSAIAAAARPAAAGHISTIRDRRRGR